MGAYEETYRRSVEDPEGYWGEAAELIDWIEPPARVLTALDRHHHRWFEGGVLNTAHNALDRHVAGGRAEQAALIHDSPVTGVVRTYTYAAPALLAFPSAPTRAVSPLNATEPPNSSSAAPSEAVSLACSLHTVPLRKYTYDAPVKLPFP